MPRFLLAAMAAFALAAAPAQAEPVKYTWHGYGINVPGSSKCGGYEMNIQVDVENGRVFGQWQQTGRVVRTFDFTMAADGSFKGVVDLQASLMNVSGRITPDSARFDMKGYCIFGGYLKKAE